VTGSRAERLDVLRATLERLPAAVASARRDQDEAPRAGEWSLRQVLAHLADAELVYGVRVRLLVGTDNPNLAGYDQERWADRFTELETIESALERWRVQREANLRLFDSLSDAEWERTGQHRERGVESVEDQLVRIADHDVGHLRQLHELT
jgi:uncharacterized damage-inducible protein DinB